VIKLITEYIDTIVYFLQECNVTMYKYISPVFLSFFISACGGSNNQSTRITEEIVFIDHYKTLCTTGPDGYCLRSHSDDDAEWYSEIYSIQDFNYIWGHTYKLRIQTEKDLAPNVVGSTTRYLLLDILEDSTVDSETLIDLSIYPHHPLEQISDQLYLYDQREITCRPTECSVINTLQDQDLNILLEVKYQESLSDPLLVTQIKCSASSISDYNNDCLGN
jgi:hypothetical protein